MLMTSSRRWFRLQLITIIIKMIGHMLKDTGWMKSISTGNMDQSSSTSVVSIHAALGTIGNLHSWWVPRIGVCCLLLSIGSMVNLNLLRIWQPRIWSIWLLSKLCLILLASWQRSTLTSQVERSLSSVAAIQEHYQPGSGRDILISPWLLGHHPELFIQLLIFGNSTNKFTSRLLRVDRGAQQLSKSYSLKLNKLCLAANLKEVH